MPGGARASLLLPRAVADDFERADSATTAGRAPNGSPWTIGNATDSFSTLAGGITSRKLVLAAVNGTDPHLHVECGDPNGVLRCRVGISLAATVSAEGPLLRRRDANNYLAVRLNNSADTISILKNLATVRSTPASTALTLADGQTVDVVVVMTPANIKVYADGVLKLTYADADHQRGTKHGVSGLHANAATFDYWSFTPSGIA